MTRDGAATGAEAADVVKVVLFCGGASLRLPEVAEAVPKPMIHIGYRPVLWHVMRSYAHFGMRDFVLCLGQRGDLVKDYFLRYDEAASNDFVLSDGGRRVELLGRDIADWRVTFADTGQHTQVGERLLRVRSHVADEEMFATNYADVVTDAPLDELAADFRGRTEVAALLAVRPSYSFHLVDDDGQGHVSGLRDVQSADLWINGGYYFFRPGVFEYLRPGEDLVGAPFERLIADQQLVAYQYAGFHTSLDTLKDLQRLQRLSETGRPPWAPWLGSEPASGAAAGWTVAPIPPTGRPGGT
ncbi:MAG: sugar phosphate nucleotidyltransferase [Candidatus Limnocylindrales bacterium]